MGLSGVTTKRGIFLSDVELRVVGCRNCVLRLNGMCYHNLGGDSEYVGSDYQGYCPEFVEWLLGISGDCETSSDLWERYHLFVGRLQASEDYGNFRRLELEIQELERCGDYRGDDWERLEQKRVMARVWWSRVTDAVLKSLGRVNDRQSRSDNVDKVTKTISLTQIHALANEARLALGCGRAGGEKDGIKDRRDRSIPD